MTRELGNAASVWSEMPFMRGQKGAERLRELLPTIRRNRAQATARRARVLAHPWAAKRLCDILGLTRADQWNGYVPPARDTGGGDEKAAAGFDKGNDSALRKALVELLRDVEEWERQQPESGE